MNDRFLVLNPSIIGGDYPMTLVLGDSYHKSFRTGYGLVTQAVSYLINYDMLSTQYNFALSLIHF